MSLKLSAFAAFDLSMTLLHTTHIAASPSLLGTSEGIAEYRAPHAGRRRCGLLGPVLREACLPPLLSPVCTGQIAGEASG